MSYYTDDPVSDYHRYDAHQQKEVERYPKCDYCDEHITAENYYDLDGDIVCEECLDRHFKKATEDYIE